MEIQLEFAYLLRQIFSNSPSNLSNLMGFGHSAENGIYLFVYGGFTMSVRCPLVDKCHKCEYDMDIGLDDFHNAEE